MKNKRLLMFILAAMTFGFVHAQESATGIILTYPGAEVSYKLDDVPTVKYVEAEGAQCAAIYLKDVAEPVVTIPLDGNALTITYGEYIATAIDGVAADKTAITERGGKKYIQGGRLVIIAKDGRQYDIQGNAIK